MLMIIKTEYMRRAGDNPRRNQDLPERRKHVLVRCDKCNNERWVYFYSFAVSSTNGKNNPLKTDLCKSCWRRWAVDTGVFKHPERVIRSRYHPTRAPDKKTSKSVNGYIRAWTTDLNHPRLYRNKRDKNPSGGKVYEHILVMEKKIGRYLKPGECVHHLDGDRKNNSQSNLVLCTTNSDHHRLHGEMERFAFDLIKQGVILFNHKTRKFHLSKGSQ